MKLISKIMASHVGVTSVGLDERIVGYASTNACYAGVLNFKAGERKITLIECFSFVL